MAKGASRSKSKSNSGTKLKKTKNSITKDHPNTLLVSGKRKRIPTERALQAFALSPKSRSKNTKKTAKPVQKKATPKRLNTMQVTASEGKSFLKDEGFSSRKKRSTSKSSGKSAEKKSNSRSKSAAKTKDNTKKSTSRSTSRSTSKSADKKPEKRTKTTDQALKDAKEMLKSLKTTRKGKKEEKKDEDTTASNDDEAEEEKPATKNPSKAVRRTKTMADAIESGKALAKGVKGRTRSKSNKKK
jgi:hypothetical protein